jgi:hypothetical protein
MDVSSINAFEAIPDSTSLKYFRKSSFVKPGPAITIEASSGTGVPELFNNFPEKLIPKPVSASGGLPDM